MHHARLGMHLQNSGAYSHMSKSQLGR
eukprot:COSAG02_NODE_32841_length_509_cov_1.441463_1_plen_26_part_01